MNTNINIQDIHGATVTKTNAISHEKRESQREGGTVVKYANLNKLGNGDILTPGRSISPIDKYDKQSN